MPTLIFLVSSSSSHSEQINTSSLLTSHVYADELNTDGHEAVCVFVYVVPPVLNAATWRCLSPLIALSTFKLRSSHNKQDAS